MKELSRWKEKGKEDMVFCKIFKLIEVRQMTCIRRKLFLSISLLVDLNRIR